MLNLKTVLFPTDFSDLANQALDHALELVQKHGATLHMLHAVVLHADDPNDPAHLFPDADEIGRRLDQIAESRMATQLEDRGAGEIEVVRAQRRGISTAPVILEYADEIDADVIVMSTHGRRGLTAALLGSVTEEVVRLSACPVLTIRGSSEAVPVPAVSNVLVPVDFSEHSAGAVSYAREICRVYGARMHLMHVFERPVQPEVYLGGRVTSLPDFASLKGRLHEALSELGNRAGAGVEAAIHVREGGSVRGILDTAAELRVDLIVIATHGLTGLKHVLLGSVAEKVVRGARCPVLTVKPFGKSLLP